ncbi:uncharacterized protein LOC127284855 [Leptopilina boulardi]|uniref:uncharacterized protein LOC127284855 n=1 Tax=Leptopilina boulardi TaxID=63433 RepID=UPI0021F64F8D|nr:uncharacterized protein LOC127284855 [Leptopilina boulardi]
MTDTGDDRTSILPFRGAEFFQFGNNVAAGGAAGGETHVDACRNIKLPGFFHSDPKLWFLQAELMFEFNRITGERQRAGAIISVLDYDIIQTISDLLGETPPSPRLYTRIKERIITNFSVSPEKELRSILRGEILTDGKPSMILSKIRHLSRGRCSEEIIKSVFLEQLPDNCRAILSLSEVDDVSRLAVVADKIVANFSPAENSVNAVSADNEILKKLEVLTKRIDALSTEPRSQGHSRSRSFSRNRYRPRDRSHHSRDFSKDKRNGKCFYHFKFGTNAKYCKSPCNLKEKSKPSTEN